VPASPIHLAGPSRGGVGRSTRLERFATNRCSPSLRGRCDSQRIAWPCARCSSRAVAPHLTADAPARVPNAGAGGVPFETPTPRHITGRVVPDTRGRGRRERRAYAGGVRARGSACGNGGICVRERDDDRLDRVASAIHAFSNVSDHVPRGCPHCDTLLGRGLGGAGHCRPGEALSGGGDGRRGHRRGGLGEGR
jgi:hypothetical protein